MIDPQPVVDALLTRRSVRDGFEDRLVPREILEQVVACGEAAPSSKNAQPWRFHVVTTRLVLDQLADLIRTAEGIESYVPRDPRTGAPHPEYSSSVLDSAAVLNNVPAAIWIENLGSFSAGRGSLLSASADGLAGALVGYGFELIGIGAAVENMWIAANALGVSASFMGDAVVAEEEIQRMLGFRGDLIGVLALGYSTARPGRSWVRRSFVDHARVVWH